MNGTKIQTILAISAGSLLLSVSYFGMAWADTGNNSVDNAQIKATNAIKNDPGMMKILDRIELFKQQYAAQQQRQTLQDQQQNLIDQQRKLANDYLQADLTSLSNINTNSPTIAYSGFVSKVNNSTQGVFQDEFAYMQAKVAEGKLAMSKVLQNGGSIDDARNAYYGGAATQMTELVNVNKETNIKHNLADATVQDLFDKNGNLKKYGSS